MRNFVVAIDGPSGTGKSTTARILADKLKVLYIDSGAMYRAITYLVLKKKINPTDSSKIIELTKSADLKLEGENVYINGEDVTKQIRSLEVTNRVSAISKIREVREILVSKQREFANSQSVIMDGRDIGTVVFPNADFKFYFTCDIKTRAARRSRILGIMG